MRLSKIHPFCHHILSVKNGIVGDGNLIDVVDEYCHTKDPITNVFLSYFDENEVMDETWAGFKCQDLHRYCDIWVAADYCDLPDEGGKYFKGGETIRESCPKGCGVC